MPTVKNIFAVALCSFFICSFAFAETITLTSGQKIETKIIERTDKYIKVDFQGIPLTYYRDEIEYIDGEKAFLPEDNDENVVAGWEGWSRSVSGYLDAVARLIDESETIAEQSNSELNEAMKKGERETGQKIIEKTGSKLALLIDEMKALVPPKDLEEYHKKIIETHEYRKKANDAFLSGDSDAASKYSLMSLTVAIQGTEELKRVYAEKGAPSESAGYFDNVIVDYKIQMNEFSDQQPPEAAQ